MRILELVLLILCYSTLIIALFLELLCYARKMEAKETIAFTFSLLLLIVSVSVSAVLETEFGNSTAFLVNSICMILVGVTTFLNILSERVHTLPKFLGKGYSILGGVLLVATILSYFFGGTEYVESAVLLFLIFSVVVSMLIVFRTKPKRQFEHLEKTEKRLALSFLIVVPGVLIFNFWFEEQYNELQVGFLIPAIFILMAVNKIYDDLKRLSIIQGKLEPNQQKFKNYNFTKREEEIATLLFEGHTYKSISEQLFISLPTVKTHASNVYKKCGVKTRHELVSLLIT